MQTIIELWHDRRKSWMVEKKPPNIENKIVIESMYSLISLGTERTLTTQIIDKEIADNMKVPYMQGNFQNEFTYGYALIGKVKQGPENLMEKMVHVMHPHQKWAVVNPTDIYLIPEGISHKTATLASNMETAVNAIWDAQVEIGDKILVIGFGTVGALTALIAKNIAGVEVMVVEANSKRKTLAEKQGFEAVTNIQEGNYDVVFNTSGKETMLQKALEITRKEGKVIEMSWYGSLEIKIKLGADFHYCRKQIISSQVSQIPERKKGNWNYLSRKKLVFQLLKELKPDFLIDQEIPFSETPDFFDQLRKNQITGTGIIIKY